MKQTILVVNICKERLHYYEFVKPIEDVLLRNKIKFYTKHYTKIVDSDLKKANKIIICGTSLKDNDFLDKINEFRWLKFYDKPIFGICGGMHVIGVIFGGLVLDKKEIGLFSEEFSKEFLGIIGRKEVYHLHGKYVDFFAMPELFEVFNKSKIPQCVKHVEQDVYGVLFHPETRNKEIVLRFCELLITN